jgi:hypothetical protein
MKARVGDQQNSSNVTFRSNSRKRKARRPRLGRVIRNGRRCHWLGRAMAKIRKSCVGLISTPPPPPSPTPSPSRPLFDDAHATARLRNNRLMTRVSSRVRRPWVVSPPGLGRAPLQGGSPPAAAALVKKPLHSLLAASALDFLLGARRGESRAPNNGPVALLGGARTVREPGNAGPPRSCLHYSAQLKPEDSISRKAEACDIYICYTLGCPPLTPTSSSCRGEA